MITGLMKNNFTQKLATGAAALGVLAGVGLAGAPAQAGAFTLVPQQILPNPPGPGDFVDSDSEWGFPGPEPIWSTFPNKTLPNPPGPGNSEGCRHGLTNCVNGWDNPLITHDKNTVAFKIDFFGSGNSLQTNNFLWNGVSLFGSSPAANVGCANVFGTPCKSVIVPAVAGALPFQFTTNLPAGTIVNNGQTPTIDPNGNVTGAHYFATIDGTWATTSNPVPQFGNMVFIGFSDGNGGLGTGDDDAADYVIKITQVPEPLTLGGVALATAFGAAFKRKLNKSDREKN